MAVVMMGDVLLSRDALVAIAALEGASTPLSAPFPDVCEECACVTRGLQLGSACLALPAMAASSNPTRCERIASLLRREGER